MDRRPSIDDLVVFLAVAEFGSMAAAARRLRIDPSTVSRRVGRIEEQLGVALFQRTGVGMAVSEAGRRLAIRVRRGLDQVDLGLDEALRPPDALRGVVRLTAPTEIGSAFLVPVLGRVQRMHPEVVFSVELTTRMVQLEQREADIALRTARPEQGDVIVRSLPGQPLLPVHAAFVDPVEARHRWIAFVHDPFVERIMSQLPNSRVVLRCNDLAGVRAACVDGLGSALMPRPLAEWWGLVPTGLPSIDAGPMWLAAPSTSLELPRVRAVWDVLVEAWGELATAEGIARWRSRAELGLGQSSAAAASADGPTLEPPSGPASGKVPKDGP